MNEKTDKTRNTPAGVPAVDKEQKSVKSDELSKEELDKAAGGLVPAVGPRR